MLNQLSAFLPKEYSPKAVTNALQPVVLAPRNEQRKNSGKLETVFAVLLLKTWKLFIYNKISRFSGDCFQVSLKELI